MSLPIWVVYKNPLDFPDKFVARLFQLDVPTDVVLVENSLEALRAQLPQGLVCFEREPEDDPVIFETWL